MAYWFVLCFVCLLNYGFYIYTCLGLIVGFLHTYLPDLLLEFELDVMMLFDMFILV